MSCVDEKPKDTVPPPFSPADSFDPWADWKPEWRDGRAPHSLQERHSPTESVQSRHRDEDARHQRRIVDARLWDAMTPSQQDAAIGIELACTTMGRGLGYAASRWDRIPGARGQGDPGAMHARLITFYIDWTRACHIRKISHAMCIDILVLGQSCAEVDRNRRVRKGTARENLFGGLSLFCELKGWRV